MGLERDRVRGGEAGISLSHKGGTTALTMKERLHQLVEELPEGQATTAAERVLLHLGQLGDDPVLDALMNAPLDDEPETDEERALVAEGMVALRRGDVVSDQELRRELGL